MELPNKTKAQIPLEKIVDYLLSETHPVGKSKAKFFRSHGFNNEDADFLAEGLLAIANRSAVESSESSNFGVKYVLSGELKTPTGNMIRVRTIWIIEEENGFPRFVTAYPAE